MKIVFASGNKHKIQDFSAIIRKYIPDIEILSMKDVGIFDDIVEDGVTFEENAMIKAKAVASHGYIGVGDDSGLTVEALGGAPGIYSARYAGEHGNDAANNAKLLDDLRDKEDKSACFVCAFACVLPDGREFSVEGKADGVIIEKASGNGGFGYDPIFYLPSLGKTFADLSAEEKNRVSHRGLAVEAFAKKLCEFIKE